ncbi:MAG: hypothetical protein QGG64_10220, partial [Candidatus Latescibacteria bacterium]|nr:hypothetical protein [Candidatus Latescibacterota bacterium]
SNAGSYFWSNGSAWGTVGIAQRKTGYRIVLKVLYGQLKIKNFELTGVGKYTFKQMLSLRQNRQKIFTMT